MSRRLDFLPKIQWGVRFVDRDASATRGRLLLEPTRGTAAICPDLARRCPLDYRLFHSAFRGDDHKPAPLTWLAPTFSSVWNNLTELRQFNIDLTGQGSLERAARSIRAATFDINEKTYAGYAQAELRVRASATR